MMARVEAHFSRANSVTMRILYSLTLVLSVLSSAHAFVVPKTASNGVFSVVKQHHHHVTAVRPAFIPTFRKTTTPLFMGWGPDPIWSSAKVLSNSVACPSEACVSVVLEVPPETAAEYTVPGQYVQVRLNEETKPLFLAIASAPSPENAQFEFLIKKTEGNEWATSLKEGDSLEISQVLGNGFAINENLNSLKYDFPTQNVLLFAAGSGIAPIKAAMESGDLELGNGRTARVYIGERTPEDLCFTSLYKKWEEKGIQVVPVLSQPPDSWQGRSGYVQNALEEDGVPIPRNCGALLCGQKGMAESVTDTLTKAGVFEGRILTNF